VEANIINLFGFTLWINILEWGKNFVLDHPIAPWGVGVNILQVTFRNCEKWQKSLHVVEKPISQQMGRSLLWMFTETC
jgi:hypothetical protein